MSLQTLPRGIPVQMELESVVQFVVYKNVSVAQIRFEEIEVTMW